MTARATVSPPKPESKMPMGASVTSKERTQSERSATVNVSQSTSRAPGRARRDRLERELGLRGRVRRVDAVEQAGDRLTSMDAGDRLGEEPRHGAHLELGPAIGRRNGVGGDDLGDRRVV